MAGVEAEGITSDKGGLCAGIRWGELQRFARRDILAADTAALLNSGIRGRADAGGVPWGSGACSTWAEPLISRSHLPRSRAGDVCQVVQPE